MKILLTLVIGVLLGAGGYWIYSQNRNNPRVQATTQKIESAASNTVDAVQEKLRAFKLSPNDIKEDLARGGQVVRRTAQQAGHAIADATADARTTAAIKAKLLASRDLSAVNISVSTTAGVVTLSGAARSADEISKAMLLAMETDGVREVISTMQIIKARPGSS
jgi:hyperosmotically inducible periplasmic protein